MINETRPLTRASNRIATSTSLLKSPGPRCWPKSFRQKVFFPQRGTADAIVSRPTNTMTTSAAHHTIAYECSEPEQRYLERLRAAGCGEELLREARDIFIMRMLLRGVPYTKPVALYTDQPVAEGLAALVCDHYPAMVKDLPRSQRRAPKRELPPNVRALGRRKMPRS